MQNKFFDHIKQLPKWAWISMALLFLAILFFYIPFSSSPTIDYNTQVKPILNKHCLHCHGGVKQNGGFSLITRELALKTIDSGKKAIVPHRPNKSELIHRITSNAPEERMPYEAPPLNKEEIDILKNWIEQGAEWGQHWAYQTLKPVEIPPLSKTVLGSVDERQTLNNWPKNNIDRFILAKMQEKQLSPNPVASSSNLLRRLSLDLIGLPPSDILQQTLLKPSDFNVESAIDSLLASSHFGEHWAAMWLDLARYADSKGFERDAHRTIWDYRDYVIKAFNEDMPYDQFLIEQLAGDLLPNPTDAQLIATGFHRNTPTNDEGGTDNEEYRVAAVIDRVNTTWEALMGTTFSCVQCHGHPYDPIFHEEYYEFMAFFNNTRDADTHPDYPHLRKFSDVQMKQLDSLQQWMEGKATKHEIAEITTFLKTWQPTTYSLEADKLENASLYDTKYLGFRQNGKARFKQVNLTDKNNLIIRASTALEGGQISIYTDSLHTQLIAKFDLPDTKWKNTFFEIPLNSTNGTYDLFFYYQNPKLPDEKDRGFTIDWMYFTKKLPGKNEEGYERSSRQLWDLMTAETEHTLIMMENPSDQKRKTPIFERGNWLSHGKVVQPNVPDIFPPLSPDVPKNRLGLAQWLTHPNHPLVARTLVNRIWAQLFGQGLVETLEDFGTQGIAPTHPELLDWLAYRFIHHHQWSLKKLIKEIVSSATYQQSSVINANLLESDPYNKFYTRGSRIRLSAEQIRDQALAVSGLLNPEMYGEPVMPYQPDGIWQVPYNDKIWTMSDSTQVYRRAIYTFVKRSAPYPLMETFDVAARQVCSARRVRTNTPLQALTTLNDPVFVEAAQYFAKKMWEAHPGDFSQQIEAGYRMALGKKYVAELASLEKEKLLILKNLYNEALSNFEENQVAAMEMVGNHDVEVEHELSAFAALVVTANAIMNLDEFLVE